MPASFRVLVRENRPLGTDFFLLDLESDSPVERAEPGQFLMLRGDWEQDPIGPRAFSILDQPAPRRILVLGLRLEQPELTIDPLERVADSEPGGLEVQVLPPQPEELSLAQSGAKGGDPEGIEPMVLR